VRIAAFCRYPASLRERAISAAHYLAGAMVGGAIAGLGVAAVAWGVIVAMGDRGRIGEALVMMLIAFTLVMAMLLWVIAIYRFHRRTTLPAGTAAPPFLLVFPLLAGLSLLSLVVLAGWSVARRAASRR
jgi:hypothetical protein